jgi:hypothetical protein
VSGGEKNSEIRLTGRGGWEWLAIGLTEQLMELRWVGQLALQFPRQAFDDPVGGHADGLAGLEHPWSRP